MPIKERAYYWVGEWVYLLNSIVSILTLCYYRPGWDFKYVAFNSKRMIKKRLNNKEL